MQQESELLTDEGGTDSSNSVTPLEILLFAWHSAKRHARAGLLVGVCVAILGVAVALVFPARYDTESRILVLQSAALTSALSSPDRDRMPTVDPFGGSSEILMQKSNLEWMVREADLLNRWRKMRPTVFRWKDQIVSAIVGQPTEKDLLRSLADMLKTRMYVMHDTTTMTIHVRWSDAASAQRLAQVAQARFFELRRTQELAAIVAAISLNEDEAKLAGEAIQRSLDEVLKIREERRNAKQSDALKSQPPTSGVAVRSTRRAAAVEGGSPPPASGKPLASMLAEIRGSQQEIEGPWRRRIAELKFQLDDLRGTYGPEHPTVRQQEAKIRDASEVPAELASLRENEKRLLAEIKAEQQADSLKPVTTTTTFRNSGDSSFPAAAGRVPSGAGTVIVTEREEDPILAPANARLDSAIRAYGEAANRVANARTQLATAQVALQNRYAVVSDPELPRKPSRPNRLLLVLGALAAAIVTGFASGAVRDLVSGKVFEPWQLRAHGLTLLGEVTLDHTSESWQRESNRR